MSDSQLGTAVRATMLRVMMMAALAGVLLAAADGVRIPDEAGGSHWPEATIESKANPGWEALLGKWEIVAVEGPDGKKAKYEDPADPYLIIKSNPENGQLQILLQGNPEGIWDRLVIDPDGTPNLYWRYSETLLPPLTPDIIGRGGVMGVLWSHPEVEVLPDGRGRIRNREPWLMKVDGDSLKVSQGFDAAGLWDLPEQVAMNKVDFGAIYYVRVKDER